jgi:hypothetical protein
MKSNFFLFAPLHLLSLKEAVKVKRDFEKLEECFKLTHQVKSYLIETSFEKHFSNKNTSKKHIDKTLNLNRKINDFGFLVCCSQIKGEASEKEIAIDFESVEMCKMILNCISARRKGMSSWNNFVLSMI